MWTKRSRKCHEQIPRISAIFFIISCNILKSARKTLSKLQKHLHIKSSHPRITAPNSEFEPKFFWEDGNSVFIDTVTTGRERHKLVLSHRDWRYSILEKKYSILTTILLYLNLLIFIIDYFVVWLAVFYQRWKKTPQSTGMEVCAVQMCFLVPSGFYKLLVKSPFLLHQYSNSSPMPSFSQAHSLSPALGCTNLAPWGNTETTAKFTFQQTFSIQALH